MKLLRRHLKVPGHRNDENQEDGLHPRIKLIAIGNKETSQWGLGRYWSHGTLYISMCNFLGGDLKAREVSSSSDKIKSRREKNNIKIGKGCEFTCSSNLEIVKPAILVYQKDQLLANWGASPSWSVAEQSHPKQMKSPLSDLAIPKLQWVH